jgi:hypothetical protein
MNAKIIQLEDKISKLIHSDNQRTVHFEYTNQEIETPFNVLESSQPVYTKTTKCQVIAHTFNSVNQEAFLLKSEVGESYEECLEKILIYIESTRKVVNSYTVIWSKKGKHERNTSYFFGATLVEIVEKFFTGKDPNQYLVYEVKMNPMS